MADKFDVLREMVNRNMDIKGYPADNIKDLRTGKQWGQITIAVDNETVARMLWGESFVFMLLVANGKQFDELAKELAGENGAH